MIRGRAWKRSLVDKFGLLAKTPTAILPTARRRRTPPKITMAEKDIQAQAEDLCDDLRVRWFRIPDKLLGFLRTEAPTWVRVFVSRYLSGVPDLMLFRPRPEGDNIVRFIEIKTEAGKLQQSQKKWHSGLNVHVTHGLAETEAAIRDFAAYTPEAS